MTRSSRANSSLGGFTLAELLVAATITTLILTALCGIYFSTGAEWEHQSGDNEALVATSQACSRISDYASQAVGAKVATRLFPSDTLLLNLPADAAYSGTYVPIWSTSRIQYRSGTWIAFYLSDSTGSPFVPGSILWSGTVTWAAGVYTITPDAGWSLYYSSSKGKIAPLRSIRFTLNESGARPIVTITAVAAYKTKQTEKQLSQSRTVCLRNTN